jgi:hypothetical protein
MNTILEPSKVNATFLDTLNDTNSNYFSVIMQQVHNLLFYRNDRSAKKEIEILYGGNQYGQVEPVFTIRSLDIKNAPSFEDVEKLVSDIAHAKETGARNGANMRGLGSKQFFSSLANAALVYVKSGNSYIIGVYAGSRFKNFLVKKKVFVGKEVYNGDEMLKAIFPFKRTNDLNESKGKYEFNNEKTFTSREDQNYSFFVQSLFETFHNGSPGLFSFENGDIFKPFDDFKSANGLSIVVTDLKNKDLLQIPTRVQVQDICVDSLGRLSTYMSKHLNAAVVKPVVISINGARVDLESHNIINPNASSCYPFKFSVDIFGGLVVTAVKEHPNKALRDGCIVVYNGANVLEPFAPQSITQIKLKAGVNTSVRDMLKAKKFAEQMLFKNQNSSRWNAFVKQANEMHDALTNNGVDSIVCIFRDLFYLHNVCFLVEADQTQCGVNLSKDGIHDPITFGNALIDSLPLHFWEWNFSNVPPSKRMLVETIKTIYIPEERKRKRELADAATQDVPIPKMRHRTKIQLIQENMALKEQLKEAKRKISLLEGSN